MVTGLANGEKSGNFSSSKMLQNICAVVKYSICTLLHTYTYITGLPAERMHLIAWPHRWIRVAGK
jgi:hypothetical protein